MKNRSWVVVLLAVVGGVALVTPFLLRLFVFEPYRIPAGSMLPTLQIGDQFFVNKTKRAPERGAIMVFTVPVPPYEDYVKRVIAVAGDEVAVRGGVVSINGVALARHALGRESFQDHDALAGGWKVFEADVYEEHNGEHVYRVLGDAAEGAPDFEPITVPVGHVFFLGDNRDHSYDSRYWGTVPEENLIGRVGTIWFSSGPEGLRSERIFESVE